MSYITRIDIQSGHIETQNLHNHRWTHHVCQRNTQWEAPINSHTAPNLHEQNSINIVHTHFPRENWKTKSSMGRYKKWTQNNLSPVWLQATKKSQTIPKLNNTHEEWNFQKKKTPNKWKIKTETNTVIRMHSSVSHSQSVFIVLSLFHENIMTSELQNRRIIVDKIEQKLCDYLYKSRTGNNDGRTKGCAHREICRVIDSYDGITYEIAHDQKKHRCSGHTRNSNWYTLVYCTRMMCVRFDGSAHTRKNQNFENSKFTHEIFYSLRLYRFVAF